MERRDRVSTTGKAGREVWTAMHCQRVTHLLSPLFVLLPLTSYLSS
jgi:hypothetical protein